MVGEMLVHLRQDKENTWRQFEPAAPSSQSSFLRSQAYRQQTCRATRSHAEWSTSSTALHTLLVALASARRHPIGTANTPSKSRTPFTPTATAISAHVMALNWSGGASVRVDQIWDPELARWFYVPVCTDDGICLLLGQTCFPTSAPHGWPPKNVCECQD